MVIVIILLVLVLRRVMDSPYNGCLNSDICLYSLFHHDHSNVYLCMINAFFYAAVNGLFGKLLNLTSEEVILKLV